MSGGLKDRLGKKKQQKQHGSQWYAMVTLLVIDMDVENGAYTKANQINPQTLSS